MENVNESLKYAAQARELIKQYQSDNAEYEPLEHDTILETALILLDKSIECMTQRST